MWLKRPSCSTAACASSRPMITRPSSRRPGMAHCYYHALSSVRKWGGTVDDYLPLHQWFDQSKAILADPRHRALRHHAERSEEHTSELQSLMRISYAVFCLTKKKDTINH